MPLLLLDLCKDSSLYKPLVQQSVEVSGLFEVLPIVTGTRRREDHVKLTSPLEFSFCFAQDYLFLLRDLIAIDTTWDILFRAESCGNAAQVLVPSRSCLFLISRDVWLHDIDLVHGAGRACQVWLLSVYTSALILKDIRLL